jgi:hypothetical protein
LYVFTGRAIRRELLRAYNCAIRKLLDVAWIARQPFAKRHGD